MVWFGEEMLCNSMVANTYLDTLVRWRVELEIEGCDQLLPQNTPASAIPLRSECMTYRSGIPTVFHECRMLLAKTAVKVSIPVSQNA